MVTQQYIFASESVSEGHPDKVCDQISDVILDHLLLRDLHAKAAVECLVTKNTVIIAGEINSTYTLTSAVLEELVRQKIKEIGYEQENSFHWATVKIYNFLHQQSQDISYAVDGSSGIEGAGDQGIIFGYACDETQELMPAPILLAHQLLHNLSKIRKKTYYDLLGPDAKSQVSVIYQEGSPVGIDSLVLSTQHNSQASSQDIRKIVREVIEETIPSTWLCPSDRIFINPSGRFVIGGPEADTGLTGRKIIVDTYGGAAPHGGGAFSGKDPSKVDRSAAYIARYLAKNIVASGIAKRCTIELSYAIGVADPLSLYLNFHETGVLSESFVHAFLKESVDMSPMGINKILNLKNPIYAKTATYGHFGRTPHGGYFSWENLSLVHSLKTLLP